MLILKDKKAVVFKLREPKRITTVIPTAKLVDHNGTTLVAVPHRPDETKVLNSLGFDVPPPMPYYYEWSGDKTPFEAQVTTASFLTMHPRAFCLNSMGLGKTITSLWAYDYLRKTKQVHKALIVCPLSTMERTWGDEVFRAFPHIDAVVLYGSRDKRKKLLAQDVNIYIINIDGLKTIKEDLKDRPDIDLIVVDELASFRNAGTDRWKFLNEICNKQVPRRVWGLTGQPTPNDPTDAWGQCRVIVPDSKEVPLYFNKFRDLVMRQVSQYKWVPRENAIDTVRRMMQPSIRFALDDCVDLPEQVFTTRDSEMTDEQREAYKAMLNKLKAEYEGGEILAVNEAVKASKLVQIACGAAYDVNGNIIDIPAHHRLTVLKELIEESEGKVLVFVPFTGVLEKVAEFLSEHWDTAIVHGATPKKERDEIFKAFQQSSTPRIIVANPATMSHGLTLTAATMIAWYAPIYSNDTYGQANARVRRPGQKKTTVIAHIAGSEIERRIYTRLQTKEKMQGLLLDIMKDT